MAAASAVLLASPANNFASSEDERNITKLSMAEIAVLKKKKTEAIETVSRELRAALKEMKFVVSASELVYEFCTSADSSSIDNIDAARRHVMAVLEFKAKEFKPYVVDSVDAVLISGDVPGMPVTVVCGKGIESVYSLSRKRPEGLPIE